jgi:hypothetical protein
VAVDLVTDLITVVVLAFVGTRLVGGVQRLGRPAVRDHVMGIVRGLRARHFLMAPVVLALVVTAAIALLAVPGLDFGWWTAIGGHGNPVTGGTDRTTGTPLEWMIPAAFLVLLIPALPLFAEREEQLFREGAEHWSTARRIRRGIEFGLVHAIVGIPIGAALALSISGWYFTWRYLAGGVPESTRAHLAYNLEVVAIVIVAIASGV